MNKKFTAIDVFRAVLETQYPDKSTTEINNVIRRTDSALIEERISRYFEGTIGVDDVWRIASPFIRYTLHRD